MRGKSRNAAGFRSESVKDFRITVSGKRPFCCAVSVHMATLVVVDSAPILKRFIGQHASNLRRWVEAQGGKIERIGGGGTTSAIRAAQSTNAITQLPGFPCAWSDCKQYRYALWRIWDGSLAPCLFIGLNPSTADESQDDPTIRRCTGFAKSWGCDSLIMVNLFAYRSTDPKQMKRATDPIGPENDEWLERLSSLTKIKVAAWGTHGSHLNRSLSVIDQIHGLQCLGLTKNGFPRHPLYLKSDSQLMPYVINSADVEHVS